MSTPLFIATERFDASDGDRWTIASRLGETSGAAGNRQPGFHALSPTVDATQEEESQHIVREDFRLDYYYNLDYLLRRIEGVRRRSVLGVYRNPRTHISSAAVHAGFHFCGYDLVEERMQDAGERIQQLRGGFPKAFRNEELNRFALIRWG